MSHYFINDPKLKSDEKVYQTKIFGNALSFTTDKGVFSFGELDFGTQTLLENLSINTNVKSLLDVGCGVGVMGIAIKKSNPNIEVTMSDVNLRALSLAMKNAEINDTKVKIIESNLYEHIDDKFDLIISNPPIRAGKQVIYSLYKEALDYLNDTGELWIVVRKQQGAKSTIEYLSTIFAKVEVKAREKGFYIIKSIK